MIAVLERYKLSDWITIALHSLLLSVSSIRMWNIYMYENSLIDRIVMVLLVLLSLCFLIFKIQKYIKAVPIVAIIMLTVVVHYWLFPENRQYIEFQLSDCWIYLITLFLCSFSMNTNMLFMSFTVSSVIILIFDLLLLNTVFFKSLTEYGYGGAGAVYSYSLLFPAIFFLYLSKLKNNKLYFIISGIPALIIFIFGGNRGSFLCYFLCLFYLYFWKYLKTVNVSKLIFFVIAIFSIVFIFPYLLEYILTSFGVEGFSPRILEALMGVREITDSGRSELRADLYERLFSFEGILGFGVMGDRVITKTHEYSHNILLEILIDFGWVVGLIIIFFMFSMIFVAHKKHSSAWIIIEIILFTKVISMWVSGTFWDDYFFWMMIAVIIKIVYSRNKYDESITYNTI